MKLINLFEAPKTLYVSRTLLNADDLYEWARSQGIAQILDKDDLHVTIIYCEKRIEWDDEKLDKRNLHIKGGHREMDIFGEDALVLKFSSKTLQARFRDFLNIGAKSRFPNYNPHITISYSADKESLDGIEPYRGELHFGPEVWTVLNKNWSDDVEEIIL